MLSKQEYYKLYYRRNKELLKTKKHCCECGCIVLQTHSTRHKATKKHKKLLNEINKLYG